VTKIELHGTFLKNSQPAVVVIFYQSTGSESDLSWESSVEALSLDLEG
jgi:hypothetical protein